MKMSIGELIAFCHSAHDEIMQKWGAHPYSFHLTSVGKNTRELLDKKHDEINDCLILHYTVHPWDVDHETDIVEERAFVFNLVAAAHDLLEDCPMKFIEFDALCRKNLSCQAYADVMLAVRLLTRNKRDDIDKYLAAIKGNPFARVVKLADLEHNLSDQPLGNRRDKYILCQQYLKF